MGQQILVYDYSFHWREVFLETSDHFFPIKDGRNFYAYKCYHLAVNTINNSSGLPGIIGKVLVWGNSYYFTFWTLGIYYDSLSNLHNSKMHKITPQYFPRRVKNKKMLGPLRRWHKHSGEAEDVILVSKWLQVC